MWLNIGFDGEVFLNSPGDWQTFFLDLPHSRNLHSPFFPTSSYQHLYGNLKKEWIFFDFKKLE